MDSRKAYVEVKALFTKDGELKPTAIIWGDGHEYEIQRITDKRRAASLKAGGAGSLLNQRPKPLQKTPKRKIKI